MTRSRKQNVLNRFVRNESGNFGIVTAIVLPLALATAGVAIDLTHIVQVRSELQNAADAAALAAASAMSSKGLTDDEAKALAKEFLAAQMANLAGSSGSLDEDFESDLKDKTSVGVVKDTSGKTGKIYDVTVNTQYEVAMNAFTALLGVKSVPLSVTSTAQSATETKNALSMHLVLDKSGSMAWITDSINTARTSCPNYTESNWRYYPNLGSSRPCYVSKIEALKSATAGLMAQLDKADPDKIYVRTAAVSYNLDQQKANSFAWGTSATSTYVNALEAEGGTDSSDAMETAYKAVSAASETTAHKNKNGQVPSRYIVFMTDGDNNYTSADTSTKATCDAAKKEGIEIYTVAFMAPSRGKSLLQNCATSLSYYYDAKDAVELVAAFQEIGAKASSAMTRLTN